MIIYYIIEVLSSSLASKRFSVMFLYYYLYFLMLCHLDFVPLLSSAINGFQDFPSIIQLVGGIILSGILGFVGNVKKEVLSMS